jgi:hypothetical protein
MADQEHCDRFISQYFACSINFIPPTFHKHLHLNTTGIGSNNGRSLDTFKAMLLSHIWVKWRDKYLHMVWWGVAGDLGREVNTPSLAEGLGFGLNKGINYCAIHAGETRQND